MIGTVPFLMQVHQEPHDYNRYTAIRIEQLLTGAGFNDVHIKPLGRLIDVYDTVEIKFFAETKGLLARALRTLRRVEMRFLRLWFGRIPASRVLTEGYGFTARKPV